MNDITSYVSGGIAALIIWIVPPMVNNRNNPTCLAQHQQSILIADVSGDRLVARPETIAICDKIENKKGEKS